MCMTTVELITAGKDIALAGAAIVTATVAIKGLNTWARQLRGTADFETARAMAKVTYKLRDEIRNSRSMLIRAGEFPDGYSNLNSSKDSATEASAYAHVFNQRWQPVYAALQEFDAQTLESEAIWGASIRMKTDELRRATRKLNAAMEAFVDNKASGGESFKQDQDFRKKIHSEVFASPQDDKNALTVEINAAIQAIEDVIRPHLKR